MHTSKVCGLFEVYVLEKSLEQKGMHHSSPPFDFARDFLSISVVFIMTPVVGPGPS